MTPAEAFMQAFDIRYPHNAFNGLRAIGDYGFAEVGVFSGRVYVHAILVPSTERGRGQGGAILRALLALADEYDCPLHGTVMAFGSSRIGLRQRELRDWYRRHGFSVSRNGCLLYVPHKAAKSKARAGAKTAAKPCDALPLGGKQGPAESQGL